MASQQFSLYWDKCEQNLLNSFEKLFNSEHFVDVSLAVETEIIKCHKVVLSACSAYFEKILIDNPCQHPVIIMRGMKYWEVSSLVNFMYKGEVNVEEDCLDDLLKAAEALQIRGLTVIDGNEKDMEKIHTKHDSSSKQVVGQPENKKIRLSNHKKLSNEVEIKQWFDKSSKTIFSKDNRSEKKCMLFLDEDSGNLLVGTNDNDENDTLDSIESQKTVVIKEEIQMEFVNTGDLDSEDDHSDCEDKSSGDNPLQLLPHPGPSNNFSNLDLNSADEPQQEEQRHHYHVTSILNRPSGRHFPERIPATGNMTNPAKKCKVCTEEGKNKGQRIRKETRYYCAICGVPLCIPDCFIKFHTKVQYSI